MHRVILLAGCLLLGSCSGWFVDVEKENALRRSAIATEPAGDYFVGRRYYVQDCYSWGFVRQPGRPWSSSRLVVMQQNHVNMPDNLPEYGAGPRRGYDHNYQYHIRGNFSGREVYVSSLNRALPVFVPTSYQLVDSKPGFLFKPDENYRKGTIELLQLY